jgi:hypothetical protein
VEEPSTASIADMCSAMRDVRFGPIADIDYSSSRAYNVCYSATPITLKLWHMIVD